MDLDQRRWQIRPGPGSGRTVIIRGIENADRSRQPNSAMSPLTVRVNELVRRLFDRLPVSPTLIKFLIVGGVGYLVNQAVLFLLYDSPIGFALPARGTDLRFIFFTISDVKLLIASIVAVETAIASNFYWHTRWTFRHRLRPRSLPVRYLIFHCTSIGSPVISVAAVNILTPVLGITPYASNTLGICLGAFWNWAWNTLVIWPKRPASEAFP